MPHSASERCAEPCGKKRSTATAVLRAAATPDAFEVLLEGAWRMARDSRLQAFGRHVQRTAAGKAQLVARRTELAAAAASEDSADDTL